MRSSASYGFKRVRTQVEPRFELFGRVEFEFSSLRAATQPTSCSPAPYELLKSCNTLQAIPNIEVRMPGLWSTPQDKRSLLQVTWTKGI